MWKAYETTFDTISSGKEGNFGANVFVRRVRWAPSYLAQPPAARTRALYLVPQESGASRLSGPRGTLAPALKSKGSSLRWSEMFLDSSLQGTTATLQPYTCCNDTDYDGGLNRYASDRVMVAGGLEIDALEGGSVAPGGPLPDDLSYTCHAAEEHAPIRAHISTK